MATRGFIVAQEAGRTRRFTWTSLLNGDDGVPVSIPGAADMTVQVLQVAAGVGDTIILEGSLEAGPPTNYFQMRDSGDNLISFTVSDGEAIAPLTAFMRPRVTGGDGTTNWTMIVLARSTM